MAETELLQRPLNLLVPLSVKNKILLGPGPSNVHPRVAESIYRQSDITHADPQLHKVMSDIKDGLRYIFQTENAATFVISATGHAGMEAAICNILQEGDTFVSTVAGIWGERAAEMGRKLKCKVVEVKSKNLGQGFVYEDFEKVLREEKPKLIYVCHGDSSTGVLQKLDWDNGKKTLGQLCHKYNCLLLVDAVASLLSSPLNVDQLDIDIAISCSQKCLSSPPGLALITFSDRAIDTVKNRKDSVVSYYFDVMKMLPAWGCQWSDDKPIFSYHSTHAVSLFIGLREAISIVVEIGLNEVVKKHQNTSRFLQEGLTKLGLELFVPDQNQRLPSVTVVKIPKEINSRKINDMEVRMKLVEKYNIDISGGIGPTAGKVWRIGLMGHNAMFEKVSMLLSALKDVLEIKSQL